MTDTPRPPAIHAPSNDGLRRSMVDIGDRRLAMVSGGDAWPTVLLENGLGAECREWRAVQGAIAPFARVVAYDRASRGASDTATAPRTIADLVDDLRALVDCAGISGPFVLVGHSLGGLIARLFANRYRQDVMALVLVESMHEDQFDRIGAALPPSLADEPWDVQYFRHFWTFGWRDPALTPEGIDLPASFAQARPVPSLGDLPMRVLSASNVMPSGLPVPLRRTMQQSHDELQLEFLHLSARAEHVAVAGDGSSILREDPAAVVDAVRSVIDEARSLRR